MTRSYHIARFMVEIDLPDACTRELLTNFEPFAAEANAEAAVLRAIVRSNGSIRGTGTPASGTLLEEYTSDMGLVQAYSLEASPVAYRIVIHSNGHHAVMDADALFTEVAISLDLDSPMAGALLSSAIRIAFSQAIIAHQGVAMHASTVVADGRAYIFVGRSGDGKSTHSRQWLQAIPGARLLNDDCPAVRLLPEGPVAFGTPWSGKTPCYLQACAPVAAIVRIQKADENQFLPLCGIEAFQTILPGCAAMRSSGRFFTAMCDTLLSITSMVQVGIIRCLAQPMAANVCFTYLNHVL